jgi:hypothetical protein
MSKELKAVRIGDKIILFIDGKRQVINRSNSPETFDIIVDYIKNNETEKIKSLFSSFDDNLKDYLKDIFLFNDKNLQFKNKNKDKKDLAFSGLIIRKAIEFYSIGTSNKPLLRFAKKIERKKEYITYQLRDFFDKLEKFSITEKGNLLLYADFKMENGDFSGKKVFGSPYEESSRYGSMSLKILSKKEESEYVKKVLISPFDIISFNRDTINIARYKIIEDSEMEGENLVKIKNEELFEMSYLIFEEYEDKKYK